MNLEYQFLGEIWPISLIERTYPNRNLAIQMIDHLDTGGTEAFAPMTINLGEKLMKNQAYLDINNLPGIDRFVIENRLGHFTGRVK